MPSQETIDLLESVLSSVNESERWQYRDADNKSRREKVDTFKLNAYRNGTAYRAAREGQKLDKNKDDGGEFYALNPKDYKRDTIRHRNKELHNKGEFANGEGYLNNPFVNDRNGIFYGSTKSYKENKPEHKELHDRINERTRKYNTTAKHEAALILIEALNTLLNE